MFEASTTSNTSCKSCNRIVGRGTKRAVTPPLIYDADAVSARQASRQASVFTPPKSGSIANRSASATKPADGVAPRQIYDVMTRHTPFCQTSKSVDQTCLATSTFLSILLALCWCSSVCNGKIELFGSMT